MKTVTVKDLVERFSLEVLADGIEMDRVIVTSFDVFKCATSSALATNPEMWSGKAIAVAFEIESEPPDKFNMRYDFNSGWSPHQLPPHALNVCLPPRVYAGIKSILEAS